MAGRGGQLCCRRLFSYVSPTGRVCVERHIAICYVLCAMCTGQHGAVDVSGEMYDAGMGYTSHELLKRLKGFNRYFFGKMNKFYN